jgi:glycosyltransferase involved in cell wall biosynthesis
MKLRVLQVVADLDDVARYLASALASLGLDVTIVAPRPARVDLSRRGMARRLTPLSVRCGQHEFATMIYEDTLAGGRGRITVLDSDTDTPDQMTATCHALVEMVRASGRMPDVIHVGAGAELMFDMAGELDSRPALVYDTPNVDDRAMLLAESARCDHLVVPSRSAAAEVGDGLECPVHGIMRGAARARPATVTKPEAKFGLQRALGLPVRPRVPLIASLGPYDPDLLGTLSRDTLSSVDAQLVFLVIKSRDTNAPSLLGSLASHLPTKIAIRTIAENEIGAATEQLLRAADFHLFGHAYRLDGTSELAGVPWGTVPVAPRVSGFADLLADFDERTATGAALLYSPGSAAAAAARASRIYKAPAFEPLLERVRALDVSWATCATRYAEVYRAALQNVKK